MSGLLCVFDPSGIPQDLPRYLSALRRLSHRGSDGEGTYLRAQVFLGHRRRALGPGSDEPQPVVDLGGRVALAFDGNLTNRRELALLSAAAGRQDPRGSDASLALAAYLRHGADCFRMLEGTWALVLWDERTRQLLASRDRLGVRPLYYFQGARVVIASEIKSILALDDEARAPNPQRIRTYLPGGLIDDWSDTFFLRVRPVPPGSVLAIAEGKIACTRFWTLTPRTNPALGPADLLELLRETIDRQIPVDADVGLALSGGIDSSVLAGLVSRRGHPSRYGRLQAFSITPPQTPSESHCIDATVRHVGVAHRYVPLDTLHYPAELDRMLESQDEPVPVAGNLYQYILRRAMAEAGCSVVLMGYGADEILAGYEPLARPFLTSLIAGGRVIDALRFALGARAFLGIAPWRILARGARDVQRWAKHRSGREAGDITGPMSGWLQILPLPTASDLLLPWDRKEETPPPEAGVDLGGLRAGRGFFEALLGCCRANIPLLVRIEDRNAAAHGLELCAPFLDHRVVEAALSYPYHQYMKNGSNKAILRRAAAGVLAPEVRAQRRKFYTPGNDAYLVYDLLRPDFLRMLESSAFSELGIWSDDCKSLFLRDSVPRARAGVWLRLYMVQRWYERIVKGRE